MTEIGKIFTALYIIEKQIADSRVYLDTNPQAIDAGFVMSQIPVLEGYAEHLQNALEQAISAFETNTGE